VHVPPRPASVRGVSLTWVGNVLNQSLPQLDCVEMNYDGVVRVRAAGPMINAEKGWLGGRSQVAMQR